MTGVLGADHESAKFLHPLLKKAFVPFMLAALLTLPSAQTLHATIPHSHDADSASEHSHPHSNALWDFIHFSLVHEEKKYAFAPLDSLHYDSLSLPAVTHIAATLTSAKWIIVHTYERQLSRGVPAHRTFG